MAEQVPSLLVLDTGLDLTTPKPAAVPGSLLDCLNYERGDAEGLARIDGYEYYDARTSPATSSFKKIILSTPHSLVVGDEVGTQELLLGRVTLLESLLKHDATDLIGTETIATVVSNFIRTEFPVYAVVPDPIGFKNIHLGTVVEVINSTTFVIACVNDDVLRIAATIVKMVPGSPATLAGVVTAVVDLNVDIYDPAANFTKRLAYATYLRSRVGQLAGVVGLHRHDDYLFAAAPSAAITEGTIGTLWRARTIQQLNDDVSGADLVVGWEEINLGEALKTIDGAPQMVKNSVPTALELDKYNSRYEFLSTNFFGAASMAALYGVSGAGRAFVFDGNGFRDINITGLTDAQDIPRHIARAGDRLALSVGSSVFLSVVGEPESFSGVLGATEIAFGEKVVGLQELPGRALGVFCENSVHYLDADLSKSTIVPNMGCIEYTLQSIGRPIYCSPAGLVSIDQTSDYGDFVANFTISDRVNPWLRPRLKSFAGRFASLPSVVCSMIVRSKSQYRLFFRDGAVLSCTFTEKGPVCLKQKYVYRPEAAPTVEEPLVIAAACSQMALDGTERLYVSHRDILSQNVLDRVLELDAGWGFAGTAIDHYFETNAVNPDSPFVNFTMSKVRVYGLAKGKATLKVQTSSTNDGYVDNYAEQVQHIDLPGPIRLYTDEFVPTTGIVDVADRGLRIKLKVSARDLTTPQPPHVCQLITTLSQSGGKLDV